MSEICIGEFMTRMDANCDSMQEFPCFSSTIFSHANKTRLANSFLPPNQILLQKMAIIHNKQAWYQDTDEPPLLGL